MPVSTFPMNTVCEGSPVSAPPTTTEPDPDPMDERGLALFSGFNLRKPPYTPTKTYTLCGDVEGNL